LVSVRSNAASHSAIAARQMRNRNKMHRPTFVRNTSFDSFYPLSGTRISSKPFPMQAQPFFLMQMVNLFMIHGPSFTAQQNVNPIIAVVDASLGKFTNLHPYANLIIAQRRRSLIPYRSSKSPTDSRRQRGLRVLLKAQLTASARSG
jgi:hypothetical protein